jgi:hypothetical protein
VPADLPFPGRSGPLDPGAGPQAPDEAALRTVRLAWAADAPSVAAAQAADLRRVLALRGEAAELPGPGDLEPVWLRAITRPPTARHRVLVAVELDAVVGFAATAPAEDPDSDVATDGEVVALHAVSRGGSAAGALAEAAITPLLAALTAAAADTLAADGFTRAQIWVASTDDVLRVVLAEAGWVPDGASRAVADDEPTSGAPPLNQVRLHVGLGGS